jgi:hypothetical protein
MALSAALPLGPGILWRGFDRCRALPEGIESASGASSSAFCFPGESERLNKHCAPKSESRVARRRERGSRRYDRGWRSPKPGYKNFPGKKSERFPAVSGH